MLFPEKLDVDKKGRPSTAGSKIKVSLRVGKEELGRGRPVLVSPPFQDLCPVSGTFYPTGPSSSSGIRGLQPNSLNPEVNHHLNNFFDLLVIYHFFKIVVKYT